MSTTVIKIDQLGKQYRIGQVGTTTIADDLKRWWYTIRGKEDPFLQIGEENDRTKKGDSDYIWALKDVSFSVNQGEVLGIIGKNGAGKSTLLKILSRTTTPTTGEYKIKGRVASLLEVGTGFHPDLTGRENIFLNGAILGMSRAEIKKQFDSIVEFSGVERYIDTPVKRYSSGMYVRLAFAVAAHLNPEILIVDEVLAVGDAEFQKRCLGKMKDVSGEGRTVLFVSHNMPSIRMLCNSIAIFDNGKLKGIGATDEMISKYLGFLDSRNEVNNGVIPENLSTYNSGEAKFKTIEVTDWDGNRVDELFFTQPFKIKFQIEINKDLQSVLLSIFVLNTYGEPVMMAVDNNKFFPANYEKGVYEMEIEFSENLMPSEYSLGLNISHYHTGSSIDNVERLHKFRVVKETKEKEMEYPWSTVHGYSFPKTKWKRSVIKTKS